MYPTCARKNGNQYRYYASKSESRFDASGKGFERLPAPEIEAAVVAQMRTVRTSPEAIASGGGGTSGRLARRSMKLRR